MSCTFETNRLRQVIHSSTFEVGIVNDNRRVFSFPLLPVSGVYSSLFDFLLPSSKRMSGADESLLSLTLSVHHYSSTEDHPPDDGIVLCASVRFRGDGNASESVNEGGSRVAGKVRADVCASTSTRRESAAEAISKTRLPNCPPRREHQHT